MPLCSSYNEISPLKLCLCLFPRIFFFLSTKSTKKINQTGIQIGLHYAPGQYLDSFVFCFNEYNNDNSRYRQPCLSLDEFNFADYISV